MYDQIAGKVWRVSRLQDFTVRALTVACLGVTVLWILGRLPG